MHVNAHGCSQGSPGGLHEVCGYILASGHTQASVKWAAPLAGWRGGRAELLRHYGTMEASRGTALVM